MLNALEEDRIHLKWYKSGDTIKLPFQRYEQVRVIRYPETSKSYMQSTPLG